MKDCTAGKGSLDFEGCKREIGTCIREIGVCKRKIWVSMGRLECEKGDCIAVQEV